MKRRYGLIVALAIAAASIPLTVSAQDGAFIPTIDVTGKGVITAAPNLASASFSIENADARADAALKRNAEIAGRVMAALKKLSIRELTVSTSSYTVHPLYDRDRDIFEKSGRAVPKGYRVRNSVTITTSRLDRMGAIIDAAVAAGADRVGSLTFLRSDGDLLEQEAAARALENAADCARRLAREAGLEIRRIRSVQYLPQDPESVGEVTAQAEEQVHVIPGRISFKAYVSVTFELAH